MTASDSAPPEAVGLYGLSLFTLNLIRLCRANSIEVAFVVDNRPESQPVGRLTPEDAERTRGIVMGLSVPLWSAELFRDAVRHGCVEVPVLAATFENDPHGRLADDAFHRAAQEVRRLSCGRIRLLHPVALGAVVRLPAYRRRFALFGYPGAGNILVQHLLHELIERLDEPMPIEHRLFGAIAEHYFLSTALLMLDRLAPLGIAGYGLTPIEFPTMALTLRLTDGSSATVQRIPSNRHLGQPTYHSHSTPSAEAIDECERLGMPVFVVVRHPFEAVLSLASKIQRPPTAVLNDREWMDAIVLGMGLWKRRLMECADRVTVVRYDDLMAREAASVRRIAGRLGVELSDSEIGALYDRLLFRDLQPEVAAGHFHRGGNDKWRKSFERWHRALFARHGLRPFFDRFGYEGLEDIRADEERAEVSESSLSPSALRPPSFLRRWLSWLGQGMAARSAQDNAKQRAGVVSVGFGFGTNWEQVPGGLRLIMRSESPRVARALGKFFQGREFLDLLNVGGIGPDSPAWTRCVPWEVFAAPRGWETNIWMSRADGRAA